MTCQVIIVLIGMITSCAPALVIPQAKDAEKTFASGNAVSLESLTRSHSLYVNKCGSCHFLYRPYQFTKEKWISIMPEMKTEARLTDDEYNSILNYLMVMQEVLPAK